MKVERCELPLCAASQGGVFELDVHSRSGSKVPG